MEPDSLPVVSKITHPRRSLGAVPGTENHAFGIIPESAPAGSWAHLGFLSAWDPQLVRGPGRRSSPHWGLLTLAPQRTACVQESPPGPIAVSAGVAGAKLSPRLT